MNPADGLSAVVLGYMGVRLTQGAVRARRTDGREQVRRIVRGVGWRHLWPIPIVLAVIVGVASLLMLIPGLDWGWWGALGGSGNPVFGSNDFTAGTVLEWIVPLVFMALLLPALPLFALAEERMFREGAEQWGTPRRVMKVVQFGAIHALIGIPIGAALALSIGGWYFMAVYLAAVRRSGTRSEGVLESTRAHTAYNGVIVVVVCISLLLGA